MSIKFSKYNIEIPVGTRVYLYNTLSGCSTLVSKEQLNYLKNIIVQFNEEDIEINKWTEVIRFLLDNGYVVAKEVDEIALALKKYDKIVTDMSQLSLVIAPSLQCNMNCYYCYEENKTDLSLKSDDSELLFNFIKSRLIKNGKLGITWFGGEPLLCKDFIVNASSNLVALCQSMNVTYSFRMVTNGYLLDSETAKELYDNGITSIQITFDGSRKEHNLVRQSELDKGNNKDSFDRITNNIKYASEFLKIIIRVNVSYKNIDNMSLLLKQLNEAGLVDKISQLYFYPVFNYKTSEPSANYLPQEGIHFTEKEFAAQERNLIDMALEQGFEIFTPLSLKVGFIGCYASHDNGFVIDHTGEIKKCDHDLGKNGTSISSLNNYNDICDTKVLQKWNEHRPENHQTCRECAFLPICYSYCPHSNLILPNSEPRCPSYKYNYKETFPLYLEQRSIN
jgi:uncharacterized protein